MPLASELALPSFDINDATLRGEVYRQAMARLRGHEGWLAACPYGFLILERESAELFLRSRDAVFPGTMIAQLFGIDEGPLHDEIVRNIISINGADHSRLRGLVNPALAPRAVQRWHPAMRAILSRLLEGLPGDGRSEFVAAVAKPYPALVIAAVMGVPEADAPSLHEWSNVIQRQFDATSLMQERPVIEAAVVEMFQWIDGVIADRRLAPGDDLISALITAESEGDRLSGDELRNLVSNILVGGIDTSQSQLAHAVRLLAEHPDQWDALRADPDRLADAAVQEALRYEPITPFTARITTAEIEHLGVTFPAGTVVLVSAWHANRDCPGPESFDITADRGSGRVLTFGAGSHYCAGANLARAEISEALAAMARTFERLELDGEPRFGTPSGIYGLESLPLRLS